MVYNKFGLDQNRKGGTTGLGQVNCITMIAILKLTSTHVTTFLRMLMDIPW